MPTIGTRHEQGAVSPVFITRVSRASENCPAGHTRPLSRTRVASFGALCRGCPLRERCTMSKSGRKIVLHQRDDMLRRARRDWAG